MKKTKVWFFTGCSTGFGREIAKKVISAGYKVVITARNIAQIENLNLDNKENVLVLRLDVTDKNQVREAVDQTMDKFGRVDVLVNNAGIGYFSSKNPPLPSAIFAIVLIGQSEQFLVGLFNFFDNGFTYFLINSYRLFCNLALLFPNTYITFIPGVYYVHRGDFMATIREVLIVKVSKFIRQ